MVSVHIHLFTTITIYQWYSILYFNCMTTQFCGNRVTVWTLRSHGRNLTWYWNHWKIKTTKMDKGNRKNNRTVQQTPSITITRHLEKNTDNQKRTPYFPVSLTWPCVYTGGVKPDFRDLRTNLPFNWFQNNNYKKVRTVDIAIWSA